MDIHCMEYNNEEATAQLQSKSQYNGLDSNVCI